ncbi:glycosyltransferase [Bacteroides thetaiotaomicron]|nr:glycosyltransferase [Bacteroides thetaiotaomicron]
MSSRLVSVVTPCYNAGSFIHRLLDSILDQDYLYLEMYIVDDGSTDNTKSVVDEYVLKFVDKGYSLTYIYQENSGQSVAINKALKLVRGITWFGLIAMIFTLVPMLYLKWFRF